MGNNYDLTAASTRPSMPAECLQIDDVLDRTAYGPPGFVAPSTKVCVLVKPVVITESYPGMFRNGWERTARDNVYGLYIDDTLVHISLEDGRVWMIEATYPITRQPAAVLGVGCSLVVTKTPMAAARSEEHTSELQSHVNLVCRLLLEKKKKMLLC